MLLNNNASGRAKMMSLDGSTIIQGQEDLGIPNRFLTVKIKNKEFAGREVIVVYINNATQKTKAKL